MENHPRVLLLGDSIRLSYQPLVVELMADRADVVGPEDNGRWTGYTQSHLADWVAELGTPAIVHWNNGLWDCGHWWERDPQQIPIDDYVNSLGELLATLRSLTPWVIWATMTPIDERRIAGQNGFDWTNAEINAYNAAALEVMTAAGVPVNDLHGVVSAELEANLGDDLQHLSEAGQQRCAAAVVRAIDLVMDGPE